MFDQKIIREDKNYGIAKLCEAVAELATKITRLNKYNDADEIEAAKIQLTNLTRLIKELWYEEKK